MKIYNYNDVISGKVKPDAWRDGRCVTIKYVGWDSVTIIDTCHNFRTIGVWPVRIAPKLPQGFQMTRHNSWNTLVGRIKANVATADFATLDKMQLDLEDLAEIVGVRSWGDDFIPWDARIDWTNWVNQFDDNWGARINQLEALIEFALPHMPLYHNHAGYKDYIMQQDLVGVEPLGNRVNPPTLKEALVLMLNKVDEFEAQA